MRIAADDFTDALCSSLNSPGLFSCCLVELKRVLWTFFEGTTRTFCYTCITGIGSEAIQYRRSNHNSMQNSSNNLVVVSFLTMGFY